MINFIEMQNVSISKNRKKILKNISLKLKAGNIYGLIGENGAGKSTLMKILTNNISGYKGKIKIFNEEMYSKEDIRQFFAGIIEQPSNYDYLSGWQNIYQYQRLYNLHIDKIKIKKIAKDFNMEKHLKKKVKNYSLGMKQRLYLMQILSVKPKVLILDEPFNGLDPDALMIFKNFLKKLKQEQCIILISTHILSELDNLCDYVFLMKDGEIQFSDSIDEINKTKIYKLKVNNRDLVFNLLIHSGYNVRKEKEWIIINSPEFIIPDIVKRISLSGFKIFSLIPQQDNIESIFLRYKKKKEEDNIDIYK